MESSKEMRKFTVEDITNWEQEYGESFFDSHTVMSNAFFLGFLLIHDKSLYNIAKPLLTQPYGEMLTLENEFNEDDNPQKQAIFLRFQEAFILACNMSETHNERLAEVLDVKEE